MSEQETVSAVQPQAEQPSPADPLPQAPSPLQMPVLLPYEERRHPLSMLTPEVQEAICASLREGASWSAAAWGAGITPLSVYQWRRIGEGRHPDREPVEPYISFARAVQVARAEAERFHVRVIKKAASGKNVVKRTETKKPDGTVQVEEQRIPADWKASAWWLERARNKQYGRRDEKRIAATVKKTDETIHRIVSNLTKDDLAILDEMERRLFGKTDERPGDTPPAALLPPPEA